MLAGSLFSGCGGLDLAASAALGAEPAWLCESDPFCRTILGRHWPGVPIVPDVREIDAGIGHVELLHGGYPCQPFSVAGQRQGTTDPRHLWPEFARLVRVLRPRHVVLENVVAHLALGFDRVLADLAALGYDTRWGCVRASDAGAPHMRTRLFGMATTDTDLQGLEGRQAPNQHQAHQDDPGPGGRLRPPLHGDADRVRWGDYEPVIRRWETAVGRTAACPTDDRGRMTPEFVEWMMGFPEGWTEGVARWHRFRMLGNAVVPQQGALALRLLGER